MDNPKKTEFDKKQNKKIVIIIVIIAVVAIIAGISFLGLGTVAYFALEKDGKGTNIISDTYDQQSNTPQIQQNNTGGLFTQNNQQQNTNGYNAVGKTQTIELMDKQVGIPFGTIDIPKGWTCELNTNWSKDADPTVTTAVKAKDPSGIATFFMNPIINFYDMPSLADQHFTFHSPLNPKEALVYVMSSRAKEDPKVAALNYRVINEEPLTNTQNTKTSILTAEYTEDGIRKHEVVSITVMVKPGTVTMWSLLVIGCADRIEVPAETVKQRLLAMTDSQKINQQWQAKRAEVSSQWEAENYQASAQRNRVVMDQFNRNLEHHRNISSQIQQTGDYIRNSNNQRHQNRMNSMDRVSRINTDTIQGNYDYNTPVGTIKDNTTSNHVWVNPNNTNERIYTNDSTYNPNADPNVNNTNWTGTERR